MARDTTAAVRAAVAPAVAAAGVDLEDLQVVSAGNRRLVRVVVDTDSGVSLDEIAELNKAVSAALDESGAMGERAYVLEITSPGVTRPLTLPRHWRRNAGRMVRVTLRDTATVAADGFGEAPGGSADSLTGRIGDCDDTGVELDSHDSRTRVAYDQIRRAVVQVEFNRPEGAHDGH